MIKTSISLNTCQSGRAHRWLTSRAATLLNEGYRYGLSSDTAYHCAKPDGTIYTVDTAYGRCSCPATVRCSHLILGEAIAEVCARHFSAPGADWFDHNCRDCGGPAWTYRRTGSYGRSWGESICPMGCECYRMEGSR